MKKKITVFCWSSGNGKYLFKGNCFEEELYKEYLQCKESEYNKNDKWVIALKNYLKSKDGEGHPQDHLESAFLENTSLDFLLFQRLNLFDVISAECFTANNELGDAMIQLCVMADLRFNVAKKEYITKDIFRIEFEVCNEDYSNECHRALITQTLPV